MKKRVLILPKSGQSNVAFCKSYFNGNTRPHLFWLSDEVFNIPAIFTFLYFSKLEKNYTKFYSNLNRKKIFLKNLMTSKRTRRTGITSTIQNTKHYHTCWSSTCHNLSTARWPTCLTSAIKSTACLVVGKDADSKR